MTLRSRLSVVRTVKARKQDGSLGEAMPITHFQDAKAWVLLGDPGSGKTSTFEALADLQGHTPISARDFIDLEPPTGGYPTPVYIDGLDEYTAGSGDGFTAIGRIRSRLQALGTPAFRLSCREADWRGNSDSAALQRLVGADQFAELHLAPLDDEQVVQFAAHWLKSNETQARAFVAETQRRDLDGLLTNPQALRMLTDAVGSNPEDWPKSKAETYAKACAKLVREQNETHLDARRDTSHTDAQLLTAAGYLCAVMLLSGSSTIAPKAAVKLQPRTVELATLITDGKQTPSLNACREVLHTNLFVGDGRGNFTAVHRTVAEYLGAQFLAARIHAHLPANRVLALIQGEDGGVVPELRGLHAWLAVVANDGVRRILIDHDPLGLVLHGDVLGFRTEEKIHLLQALQREASHYAHFRSQNWASQPFGALATPDMAEHFRTWLQSPDRSPAHQAVLDCVLDAMEHGQPMPVLAADLERIVGDKTYWSGLRRSALHTLCAGAASPADWTALQRILQAILQGKIQDEDNDLMGVLLHKLYPKIINAKDLWRYYKPVSPTHINHHWEFWRYLATRHAPREDIPLLMDGLLATELRLHSTAGENFQSEMIGALLQEAIVHFAEHTTTERVYAWLTLGMGSYGDNCLPQETQATLGKWLTAHPHLYRRLVEHGITVQEKSDRPIHMWLYEIHNLLCKAARPDDTANWYWELAEKRTDGLRQQLLQEVFWLTEERDGADAALVRMSLWTQQHPEDSEWVHAELLSCPYPPDTWRGEEIDRTLKRRKEKSEQNAEELAFLSDALPKLIYDNAHVGLLNHIGEAYIDFYHRGGAATPRERLLKKLHNDPHWVQMALAGLRHCLRPRTDLPSVADILALHRQSRRYTVATSVLAAMQLRYDEDSSTALNLDDSLLQTLVAFRLTNHYGNTPEWFSVLVQSRPALVARVMQQLIAQQIAAKVEHVAGLYALAHDPHYAQIAQIILPGLIETLPGRLGKTQLGSARTLITCLLRRLDQSQQLGLIAKRLALPVMDIAQHVYWLTAGVQLAPAMYLVPLQRYLGTNQTRGAHAYALLREQRKKDEGMNRLTLEANAFFIELMGASFTPSEEPKSGEAYRLSPAIENMRFVQWLISTIAADPSEGARETLGKLVQSPALKPWVSQLQHAVYEQQLLRRKALFKPATVPEVCNTLANLQPANAADLHALVLDHLTVLGHDIRHSSTDNYDQYWDGKTPKLENPCRNVLLDHLKVRLAPLGITAEQEGTYADQKRADIKISCGALHLPVEIKRDSHADLWKAIREQLIGKYSRELTSDGYGVYIVFWFGGEDMPNAGDGGKPPKTPQELQSRLAATVPSEVARKVAVLVIDCSRPYSFNGNKKAT
jgi:hypothetical protein